MEKEKYEKRVIEGKEVKIKIIYQPHGAWAMLDGKTIRLNEKTKKELKKEELNSIFLHERGHHTIFNQALTWVPMIIIFGCLVYLFSIYGKPIITFFLVWFPIILTLALLFLFMIALFILNTTLNLILSWTKEIHADWYAVKKNKKRYF